MAFAYHIKDHLSDSRELIGNFSTYEEAETVRQTYTCADVEKTWDGRPTHSVPYKPGKALSVGSFVIIFGKEWEVVDLKNGHSLSDTEQNLATTWATLAQVI